jgi:hypothetical protein
MACNVMKVRALRLVLRVLCADVFELEVCMLSVRDEAMLYGRCFVVLYGPARPAVDVCSDNSNLRMPTAVQCAKVADPNARCELC